ncbi:MAG: nickel pincer cofactor biosynthesis protein LarB [Deltaproteobacteria bacterium]|nr:nickel pincer cofactor biosynthesis protein LarB [Deltaproteobacteria bacterium]
MKKEQAVVQWEELKLDFARKDRIGFEEAILCPGKTQEHLETILDQAVFHGASLLLTRMTAEQIAQLRSDHRDQIDYEPVSRTAYFGTQSLPDPQRAARVAVVAAGTSDAFVTREITRTLRYAGESASTFVDVGLAGLWRVMERIETIAQHPIVIVVAGMDAALPTVVGGLVGSVVFAVPTSNGYGVAAGGESALRAVLASCSPGLAVLNIDNGYGAACAALRVLRAIDGERRETP